MGEPEEALRLYEASLALTRANLADADLTGATVVGANFTGANLVGAKLPAEVGRAKGIDQSTQGGRVGPCLSELDELAQRASLKTTIVCEVGEDRALLEAEQGSSKGYKRRYTVRYHKSTRTGSDWQFDHPASLSAGMLALGRKFVREKLLLDTLTAECDRKLRGKDLWAVVDC